jgi:hypothetical protein
MHRKDAALRREIICDGENAFHHLAGVFRPGNDELSIFEADADAHRHC